MTKPTFEKLRDDYTALWETMAIRPERLSQAKAIARKIYANRDKYQAVEAETGVPWWWVGLAHYRESNCDFETHLHNGDPLTDRTKLVPAGRPKKGEPPFGWDESACDALTLKGLQKIGDWTLERTAYELERYNGFGPRNRGIKTGYLWSYSNHYERGKYIADHVWSAAAKDAQCGVMPVLKCLMELDESILSEAANVVKFPIQEIPSVPDPLPTVKPREVAAQGSRSMSWLQRALAFFGFGTVSTSGLLTADNFSLTKGYVNDIANLLRDNATLLLLVGCAGGFLISAVIRHYLMEAHSSGRYSPRGAVAGDSETP